MVDDELYGERLSIRLTLNDDVRRVGSHIGHVLRSSYREEEYGKTIMRVGLVKMRWFDLKWGLVPCDLAGPISSRIVEVNGGTLVDTVRFASSERLTLSFWIVL